MKKGVMLSVVLGVLVFSMFGFVSAATVGEQVGNAINDFIVGTSKALEPVLRYTLGGADLATNQQLSAEAFIVKVLLFILMLSILYFAVGKVPMFEENSWLHWIVATVTAILGARFMTAEALINFVWLPTGVIAVALTSLLPFIIYFFFIESFTGQKLIRKVGWVLFGVLYLGLAITRWDTFALKIGETGGFNLAWLYVATAILAALAVLFDRPIQKKKDEGDRKRATKSQIVFVEHDLAKEKKNLVDDLARAHDDAERSRIQALIKDVDKRIAAVAAHS